MDLVVFVVEFVMGFCWFVVAGGWFLLGWWWLVEEMVELCWVCGGWRILIVGFVVVLFLFFLRCVKHRKIFEKKPFSLKSFTFKKIYIEKYFTTKQTDKLVYES